MFGTTTALLKVNQMMKRIRAVQGGTSASKTISILLYLIARSQSDKHPTLTSIVSESIPHLKRGAMRDFKNIMVSSKYWKDDAWNSTDSIYTFETGSQIEFFSADNADKLRGGRRDRLFINEANNVTFESFEQLEVRTKEFIFLDWNPTNEFWFYTNVQPDRTDVELIILTYKDNEGLSQDIINSIEQRRTRKSWWKVYGEGQLGEVDGKVYTNWKIVDEIPHEARLVRRGLDFGYTNDPTALVDIYYYNGGYILDEQLYRKGMKNPAIAQFINNLEKPETTVIADSSEPKSIDEIKDYGVAVIGIKKGKDSIKYGIGIVQDQQISVTKRSTNVIKEYRNYLFKTDDLTGKVLNEPDDLQDDHTLDAIRYAFMTLIKKEETVDEDAWEKVNEDKEEAWNDIFGAG